MPDNNVNTEAFGNGSREIVELTLLLEINRTLQESLELRSALKPVLEMIARHLDMMRGALTILNRSSGEIVIEESYGLLPEQKARGKYQVGEGITGTVVATGKAMVVPRIAQEPQFLDRTGSRQHLDKHDISFICVPIRSGQETIGALSVDRLFNEQISLTEDVRVLTIIAAIISQAVRLRQLAQEEVEKLQLENMRLQGQLNDRFRPDNIIGNAKTMRIMFPLIEQVSRTNTTALIVGESGVGKELVAQAIHYNSGRSERAFVKVNCAALPEHLIESELFGHEKGAFTGAFNQRKGRFELADSGSLFLDEIGEIPPTVQVKLLRVLQEREFERVGGTQTLKVNVRLICATNRDLSQLIQSGKFREDLFYRLNVFPIPVPPLRERKTDIILLADHFVEKYNREHGKRVRRISTPAIDLLMAYHWPGNVRELENCIERAVIVSRDDVIHAHDLPPSLQSGQSSGTEFSGSMSERLAAFEKELIIEALKAQNGTVARAARELGVSERLLGLRLRRLGIEPKRFKNVSPHVRD